MKKGFKLKKCLVGGFLGFVFYFLNLIINHLFHIATPVTWLTEKIFYIATPVFQIIQIFSRYECGNSCIDLLFLYLIVVSIFVLLLCGFLGCLIISFLSLSYTKRGEDEI